MYVYMYVCMYVCVCVYIYIYICICMCVSPSLRASDGGPTAQRPVPSGRAPLYSIYSSNYFTFI